MAVHSSEKSPIELSDYQGLQLDTRAGDITEKYVDAEKASIAEAEARDLARSRSSAASTADASRAPSAREKRICGLRRQLFWIILANILVIILVAAGVGGVVGGVVGSRHKKTTSASTPSSSSSGPASPNMTDGGAGTVSEPQSNVIAGSPNSTNSNVTNGTCPGDQQSLRLFFQSAHGNIKASGYDGVLAPWRGANPIFTDAVNNSGLCVFTYLNGTEQSFTIYYVGMNGLVQEKRASLGQSVFLPSATNSLNSLNLKPAVATASVQTQDSNATPKNSWDSYRMAVVYSTNFHDGPGARLFYHFAAENGTTWVQEMIWNQGPDMWTRGAMLTDPWPGSRLAAVIDETSKILRIFYSAGNLTLQESYLNIQEANATYETGIKIPNLLASDDADLAAVAVNEDALVYYYSNQGTPSIRELNISGLPGSQSMQESYNLSSGSIVAQPALDANGSLALHQPIGAVLTNASGVEPSIYVSWAEHNAAANSSYGAMTVVSRHISDKTWPNSTYGKGQGQVPIPLGTSNVDPAS